MLLSRLASPLGAFVILIGIGHTSDALLGKYALITTYYYVLQTLPLLGLTSYYMREVSRNPGEVSKYYFTIGGLAVVACIVIYGVLAAALPASDYEPDVINALEIVSLAIVPGILSFLAEITLTSLQRTERIAYIALTENTVRVILSLTVLFLGYGIEALIWVIVLSRTVAMMAYYFALKAVDPSFFGSVFSQRKFDIEIFRLTKIVLPVFLLNTVLGTMLSRMDFIVLSLYAKIEAIGYYAIAYRLFEVTGLVLTALLTATFPVLARGFTYHKIHFRALQRTYITLLGLVSVFVSLVGFAFSDLYVRLLFPEQYPIPVQLTEWFTLLIVVYALDSGLTFLMNATNQQKRDTYSLMVSTPVYAVTLLLFVPWLGLDGALLASAFTLITQATFKAYYVCSSQFPPWSYRRSILYAGTLLLSVGFGVVIQQDYIESPLLWALFYSLCINPLLLFCFGFIQPFRALMLLLLSSNRNSPTINLGTLEGMFKAVAIDTAKHRRWWNLKNGDGISVSNWGLWTIVLYRFSHYCLVKNYRICSRLLWQVQTFLCKSDFRPDANIGVGFLADAPTAVGVAGNIGPNCTLMAHSATGRSGSQDVGYGAGLPDLEGDNLLQPRAYLLGGIVLPRFEGLPACSAIKSRKDMLMLDK